MSEILWIIAISLWLFLAFQLFVCVPHHKKNKECPHCGESGGMEYNDLTTATQGEWRKKCEHCGAVWYREGGSNNSIEDVSMYHRK